MGSGLAVKQQVMEALSWPREPTHDKICAALESYVVLTEEEAALVRGLVARIGRDYDSNEFLPLLVLLTPSKNRS